MNNANNQTSAEKSASPMHPSSLDFHVVITAGADEGLRLGYGTLGFHLGPDPDGHFSKKLVGLARRYGGRRYPMQASRVVITARLSSGLRVDVVECATCTFVEFTRCKRVYSVRVGPGSCDFRLLVDELRGRFPDCAYG